MLRFSLFVLFLVLSLGLSGVRADTQTGYQWLGQQQQADGGIYTASEEALGYQATFEAMEVSPVSFQAAQVGTYTASAGDGSTEFLSRQVLLEQGGALELDLADQLVLRQNLDGGFGNDKGYDSTPYDTYWALMALADASADTLTITRELGFLVGAQNQDGGWSYPESFSSLKLTAEIEALLARLRYRHTFIQMTHNRALDFLLAAQGTPQTVDEKALLLEAVVLASTSRDQASAIATELEQLQQANGSWAGRAYPTALALRALRLYQNGGVIDNATPVIASVKGRVVLAGTSMPLAGVTVTFDGGRVVTTDATGGFLLSGLPSGRYAVSLGKEGFQGVSRVVSLSSVMTVDLGVIALEQGATSAQLTGLVYDDQTRLPIAHAQVIVDGWLLYPVTTNGAGQVELSGLFSGEYQLEIVAEEYLPYSGTIVVESGKSTQFLQGMIPFGVVLDDQAGPVKGRVVDGNTGQALAGAAITLSGRGTLLADTTGAFRWESVTRGTVASQVSASGYASRTLYYAYPAGSSGEVGGDPSLCNPGVYRTLRPGSLCGGQKQHYRGGDTRRVLAA